MDHFKVIDDVFGVSCEQEDDAASGAQTGYRMVSDMKTAYDKLSIVQSVETSSSQYAGFTLLVNNSGTPPCFLADEE